MLNIAAGSSMHALGERTIQFYLEKTKYYQGKIRSKKFRDKITSQEWVNQAYCFDYDKMNEANIINLIGSKTIETDNPFMTTEDENVDTEEQNNYNAADNEKDACMKLAFGE